MSRRIGGGRSFALLVGLLVLVSAGIGSVAAVSASNSALNYSSTAAQQQHYRGQVSIAKYMMSWSGVKYENNQGKVTSFAGSINQSARNPVAYSPTKMAVPDFSKFPHSKTGVSALNASEWTANGTSTVSNVKPANGVNAVKMSLTQGNATTFSNFSITSNENKKTLMAAFNVNKLAAGSTIQLRINDTNGDYKMATINTSKASGAQYAANSTGNGFIYQKQLGKLPTHTTPGSDGVFNNIQSIQVKPTSGSGSVTFTALNLDKTGRYVFGTHNSTSGSSSTIYEHKTPGRLHVTGLGSLGSSFSQATLHGLDVKFVRYASSLPSADVNVTYSNAKAFPSFSAKLNVYDRMSLPTGYDLTYRNLALVADQQLPKTRYQQLGVVSGASSTPFSQVSYASESGRLGSQGKRVVLDSAVQPSQTTDVHWQYLITSSEQTSLQQTGAAGVIGGGSGGGGGIMSMILSWPGMLTAAVLGFFGARRAGML